MGKKSLNGLVIRDFSVDDYQASAEINNAVDPDWPTTPASLREEDDRREPDCGYHRWVAELRKDVVATGYYIQPPERFNPDRYNVVLQVHPDFQCQGIGGALYDRMVDELRRRNARVLRTCAREDSEVAVSMIERRGFHEYERVIESHLDVGRCDLSPTLEREAALEEKSIKIMSLPELETDPERDPKLYELDWELNQDTPGAEELKRPDFTSFIEDSIKAPNVLPEGYFVATRDGQYIGLCVVESDPGSDSLLHGITGIVRRYRRQGLAMALKRRVIRFARDRGYTTIRTCNDVNNEAILNLNKRLGFVSKPAWVKYEKELEIL